MRIIGWIRRGCYRLAGLIPRADKIVRQLSQVEQFVMCQRAVQSSARLDGSKRGESVRRPGALIAAPRDPG